MAELLSEWEETKQMAGQAEWTEHLRRRDKKKMQILFYLIYLFILLIILRC